MFIKFSNGKSYEYLNAYALENDYCKGIKRPSLEIHMPVNVISYNQLEKILNDASNLKEIVLTGDKPPIYNETGEVIGYGEAPQNTYCDYDIKGKITIDDEEITFKLYKKSDLEIENEEAIATIDELLIALEA
jgi:hypothetical protein